MRVAVVCPYSIDVPGGVQGQAIGLVDGIRAAGHEAWLVAPGVIGTPRARLVGRPVQLRVNGSVAAVSLHPATVARVRRAVADADVVHVHEPFLPPTSPAAFLGPGPPAVGTFHADPSRTVRGLYRLAGRGLKRVIAELAAVTVVSSQAGSAVDHLIERAVTIPNGIDTASYAVDVERHSRRVVFLGRDEPRKGLDVLLAAWPRVRNAVPGAELVVLGARRDESREGIRYLGKSVGIAKRQQLAEASIYCAPNLGGESFGISLVEGMAAGCAPVVSDLRAFRFVAGEIARYAPVGDSTGLAEQLILSLLDPKETLERGTAAARAAAAYDWKHVLPAYMDIYTRLGR